MWKFSSQAPEGARTVESNSSLKTQTRQELVYVMHINEGFIEHLPLINITHYIFININQTRVAQHQPAYTSSRPNALIFRHFPCFSSYHSLARPYINSLLALLNFSKKLSQLYMRGWDVLLLCRWRRQEKRIKVKRREVSAVGRYQKFPHRRRRFEKILLLMND